MGEATDKLKAAGNKLAGNVKEGIGKDEAESIKTKLSEAGAVIEIE